MTCNFPLTWLPQRSSKPREKGLTMVMDKGLSIREAADMSDVAGEYIDLVKLGFGTSLITPRLKEKLALYKEAGLRPYFGGTLFELFIIRNAFDEFRKMISDHKMDLVEISDGSMYMDHEKKLEYIRTLANDVTVLSEVGSKQAGVIISDEQWVRMTKNELQAGVWKVIAEARESGNMGIYKNDGDANKKLIDDIIKEVPEEKILWEAPIKKQQVWFIKLLGAEVNLGNIPTNEVIPLETLRLGLRGDTFNEFLPDELKKNYK